VREDASIVAWRLGRSPFGSRWKTSGGGVGGCGDGATRMQCIGVHEPYPVACPTHSLAPFRV
jgi:hypothetical protein